MRTRRVLGRELRVGQIVMGVDEPINWSKHNLWKIIKITKDGIGLKSKDGVHSGYSYMPDVIYEIAEEEENEWGEVCP